MVTSIVETKWLSRIKQRYGSALMDRIGNTPLIQLDSVVRRLPEVTLLGKAEWMNPGGSVKDRAAAAMVGKAIADGSLCKGKILLDATSGNTGIAFAMLGAALGFPVLLAMPSNVSLERKRILKAYGAQVEWTDPDQGSDGAIRRVREMAENDPGLFCYMDQYSNPENWKAHYDTTAPEIWRQSGGSITHFIAGLGTSGTFVGTVRRLKELNPQLQAVSVQPDSPFNGLEGLKHMATAIVPAIYDRQLADRNVRGRNRSGVCVMVTAARARKQGCWWVRRLQPPSLPASKSRNKKLRPDGRRPSSQCYRIQRTNI